MISRNTDKIILFTRYPRPGRVKTRLIPALGSVGAAHLQRRMTERSWATVCSLVATPEYDAEVRYQGGNQHDMTDWLGEGVIMRPQGDGDLGDRLKRAFADSFREGNQRVVIVGSDCPSLTAQHLAQALRVLRTHKLTIGPASDGGYYLIGLSRPVPQLFEGITWGSSTVLGQTLSAASRIGVEPLLLETLSDVDRPEDLAIAQCFELLR